MYLRKWGHLEKAAAVLHVAGRGVCVCGCVTLLERVGIGLGQS